MTIFLKILPKIWRCIGLDYKENTRQLLKGKGLEIGALHNKFVSKKLDGTEIEYLDVADTTTMASTFQELESNSIQAPNYIANVSHDSVHVITKKKYHFIICNHVLEHVPNPIKFLNNTFDGLEENGLLVISIPDKRFSFDRARISTTFDYLLSAYYLDLQQSSVDRYIDFLIAVHPETLSNRETFLSSLRNVTERLEHVHVWKTNEFLEQFLKICNFLKIKIKIELQSNALVNGSECFLVVRYLGKYE